jgi:CRP-like cAMP-binding protein
MLSALRVPAFLDCHMDELADIAEHLELLSVPAGETLFKLGDHGDKLYVLMTGTVGVWLPTSTSPTASGSSIASSELMRVSTTKAGQVFGELALLGQDRRSATIIADGPCDTLTLDASTYLDVVRGTFERDLLQKMDRLKSLSYFKRLNRLELLHLAATLQDETHPVDTWLYQQGDVGNGAFLIVDGDVEERWLLSHHTAQGGSYVCVDTVGVNQLCGELACIR